MVLGPGWPQRRPRPVQHLVGPLAEDAGRPALDVLGVEEVDLPAALACEIGQHPAVHDRVGACLVRHAPLHGDVVGEVRRPGAQRHRHDRLGQRRRELVQRRRRRTHRRRSHLRDQHRGGGVVEGLALVVDRRGRHAGLDQLDPPAVHDPVVGRSRDGHGPAEVMGDAQAHAAESAAAGPPRRTSAFGRGRRPQRRPSSIGRVRRGRPLTCRLAPGCEPSCDVVHVLLEDREA